MLIVITLIPSKKHIRMQVKIKVQYYRLIRADKRIINYSKGNNMRMTFKAYVLLRIV